MLIWLALGFGCSDVEISYYAEICTEWDFDQADSSDLLLAEQGESLQFLRAGVERACDASFQPEIEAHGRIIQVFELWESTAEEDDCVTCFTPIVTLSGLKQRGSYEFHWFEGRESTVPVGVLEWDQAGESTE